MIPETGARSRIGLEKPLRVFSVKNSLSILVKFLDPLPILPELELQSSRHVNLVKIVINEKHVRIAIERQEEKPNVIV